MPAGDRFTPLATFCGLRRVPLVAVWHNSLFPALVVAPAAVAIRVIGMRVLAYEEIETILFAERLGERITFVPKRGLLTFTASFAGRSTAPTVLARLAEHGAPLDPKARERASRILPSGPR